MGVYDLCCDGGVVKTIIKEAKVNALWPTKDMPLVDVHYVGYLADTHKVFHSTREGYNRYVSFEIGRDPVIRGLEIALPTMKVGEIAKLTFKPEYAYGSAGYPPAIPRNATIIFEMELLACRPQIYANPLSSSNRIVWAADMVSKLKKPPSLADVQDNYKKLMDMMEKAEKKKEAEVVGVVYDLTGDRGVLKKIITKAEGNAIVPTNMSVVDVWYNDFIFELETGEKFNFIFEDGATLTFRVGSEVVMPGWDIALKKMKVGDVATITCQPGYAYGKKGSPPEIPPNLTVTATLKLLKCEALEWSAKPFNVKELKEFKLLADWAEAVAAAAEATIGSREDEDCDLVKAKKAAAGAAREAKKAAAVSEWADVKAAAAAATEYYAVAAAAAVRAQYKLGVMKKIKGAKRFRTPLLHV